MLSLTNTDDENGKKAFKLSFLRTGSSSSSCSLAVPRSKERMYAPPNLDCESDTGGIGFVAVEGSFYRAAKSQRIE